MYFNFIASICPGAEEDLADANVITEPNILVIIPNFPIEIAIIGKSFISETASNKLITSFLFLGI